MQATQPIKMYLCIKSEHINIYPIFNLKYYYAYFIKVNFQKFIPNTSANIYSKYAFDSKYLHETRIILNPK